MESIQTEQQLYEDFFLCTLLNNESNKTLTVCEESFADGNFVLNYFIKWILNSDDNQMCLLNLHHTVTHYQNIGKKLGFEFLEKIKSGNVTVLEPMKIFVNEQQFEIDSIIKYLFMHLKGISDEKCAIKPNRRQFLIIDDISHFFDIGVHVNDVFTFVNCCTNLGFTLIILTHKSDKMDQLISNMLCHISDVFLHIFPLKTGISKDISGVLECSCQNNTILLSQSIYHFKAFNTKIKLFQRGEAMQLFHK